MADDPFESAEWKAYAEHVVNELVPKLESSAITLSLVPDGDPDVKFAVELGFCIMMDKPIIAVVSPNAKVPAKMVAVADAIVEGPIDDPSFQQRLMAALDEVLPKNG